MDEKVTTRQKGRRNSNRNSFISNRLSIISTDSEGKKSCDSVEVIGSPSCATSPDTDLPSISTSSSMGLPVSLSCTESVEVKFYYQSKLFSSYILTSVLISRSTLVNIKKICKWKHLFRYVIVALIIDFKYRVMTYCLAFNDQYRYLWVI